MSHKFVKVGDVVKLKAGTKLWDKLSYDGRYMVMKTEPNPGYTDNTCFITKLEDGRSNIINLKINERYFDIIWKDEEHTMKTKFAVSDRVISIIDTPNIPEGFIGHIFSADKGPSWDYMVQGIKDQAVEYFNEDELELLSVGGKEDFKDIKIPHDSVGLSFDDPKMKVTPADFTGIVKEDLEYTGGSSSYYKVDVTNPTTSDAPYQAECNDVIEALGLTFTEGNIFKAIWRIAADRNGKKKKGNNSVYDAEKVVFFAERLLIQEKSKDKE